MWLQRKQEILFFMPHIILPFSKSLLPTLPTMQFFSDYFLWSHILILANPKTCKHTLMRKIGGITISTMYALLLHSQSKQHSQL